MKGQLMFNLYNIKAWWNRRKALKEVKEVFGKCPARLAVMNYGPNHIGISNGNGRWIKGIIPTTVEPRDIIKGWYTGKIFIVMSTTKILTSDDGLIWRLTFPTRPETTIWRDIAGMGSIVILVGTKGSIEISYNHGLTWVTKDVTGIEGEKYDGTFNAIHGDNRGMVLLGRGDAVWLTDGYTFYKQTYL